MIGNKRHRVKYHLPQVAIDKTNFINKKPIKARLFHIKQGINKIKETDTSHKKILC